MGSRHDGDERQAQRRAGPQRVASLGIAAFAALVLVGGTALLGAQACASSNDAKAPRDAPKPGVTTPQPEPQPKQPEPKPEPEPLPPPAT